MSKFWSVFFGFFALLAAGSFVVSPSMGWWFPGTSVSPLGSEIDDLFYLILVITSITFIGTHMVLAYVLWRFSGVEGRKSTFTHGSHTLEVIWTIVPAGVLLFISLYQMDVWARFRVVRNFDREAMLTPVAEVTARQFEWRIRYPAPGTKFHNERELEAWLRQPLPTDLYGVNDLHVPVGRSVVIRLKSEDVLHSFFLPHLRVKQDAVPGPMSIPVQFQADKTGIYELVCAELCGWGHYKMRGQLTAQSPGDYETYLKSLRKSQFDDGTQPAASAGSR